jgi:hypothetical protein
MRASQSLNPDRSPLNRHILWRRDPWTDRLSCLDDEATYLRCYATRVADGAKSAYRGHALLHTCDGLTGLMNDEAKQTEKCTTFRGSMQAPDGEVESKPRDHMGEQ